MATSELACLMAWYSDHCNGDWEHGYGIQISTLDNPGWRFAVDLVSTDLEGKTQERAIHELSDLDWFQTWSDGAKFEGACGPMNLGEVIAAFCAFADRAS